VAYGQELVYSGPLYKGMKVEEDKIRLTFDHVGGGLAIALAPPADAPVPPASGLKGFAIAGADRKFVPAQAKIEQDTVVVWSDQVKLPLAVRYGWTDTPDVNLYNKEHLPASPFRTDDWK
jgi:sialate O-acetylesterase